jgi:hypothetical protein
MFTDELKSGDRLPFFILLGELSSCFVDVFVQAAALASALPGWAALALALLGYAAAMDHVHNIHCDSVWVAFCHILQVVEAVVKVGDC